MAPVLVTGATGYIGGRLAPMLLERGFTVRAAARSTGRLSCRPWARHPNLELVQADLLDVESLKAAMQGCETAYYLVHSMNPDARDFAVTDREAAYNFVQAARDTGLKRIIYLSGLGELDDPHLSTHLRSRAEVGRILQLAPAQVTILRAAVILGSGSASFEILRYLAERLPVMITPRWVRTKSQPIAASNVLGYLAGCLEAPETAGQTLDIGGPDILSYQDLFQVYAQEAGLRRRIILPVPFLSPKLSGLWLGFITPVPTSLAKPLVKGLKNEAVCKENRIRQLVPQQLLSCRQAIRRALDRVAQHSVDTCWHDAGAPETPEWMACGDPAYASGDVLQDGFKAVLGGPPESVWPAIAQVGGQTGWYFGNALWGLRGFLDRLAGGPGIRRGRRHPTELRPGDAVDWWRVVRADPPDVLILQAEMRTPGEALLQFRLQPVAHPQRPGAHATQLTMVPRFLPHGLAGHAYWWAMYPFHGYIFKGMFRGLAKATGLPIVSGPHSYTPGQADVCPLR